MTGEELFLNELNFHIRQGISKKDLTDLINERIKQLTIPVVSKPKGTVCKHKGCKHRHVNEFDGYCLKHYNQPAN